MKNVFFSFFIFISYSLFGQEEQPVKLYPLIMYYEGSNFQIDPNYQYKLNDLVVYLNTNPTVHIHIRGHVCCGPDKKLSRKRAKAVYKYLRRQYIPKQQLSYKGYSDSEPLAFPEKTEEDEQKNRRVDFVIRK